MTGLILISCVFAKFALKMGKQPSNHNNLTSHIPAPMPALLDSVDGAIESVYGRGCLGEKKYLCVCVCVFFCFFSLEIPSSLHVLVVFEI